MASNLVIVESPAKAKTINKILGKDFLVKASMGHVRDLPEKKLGIDLDHNFKLSYSAIPSRKKIIEELQQAATKADTIYLAPDPDREGEAIAWHLQALLKGKVPEDRFFRITYNEITAPAIRQALEHPGRINQHKVDAQQARRALDRIVGYKVSPLLWRRIRGAFSAGRVQSVALRLVCEREDLIANFKPEKFWLLGARTRKLEDPRDIFRVRLARIDGEKAEVKTPEQALEILQAVEGRPLRVAALTEKQVRKSAPPPFITSTLQQAASGACGYAPARTMRIAQHLYEGADFGEGPVGLITYMRTDSFNIAAEAREQCAAYIRETFGPDFLPAKPNFFKSRSSAQEAHEAIRPTSVLRTPESLRSQLQPDELKLYELIWKRFVACQMAPAVLAQRAAEIESVPAAGPVRHLFRASASEILFPGYMKLTGVDKKAVAPENADDPQNGEEEENFLPPLKEGEPVEAVEWLKEEKETQPPARYTEASLIRALEENGVGRPSTYASILATLADREYVTKEKRSLMPTSIGTQVNTFLVTNLNPLFEVGFTAAMEEKLDRIEDGSVEWTAMLKEFYDQFAVWIVQARGPDADPGKLGELLKLCERITAFAPPEKRGKRTYSDEKFVQSVREQLAAGEKALSGRQLEAVVKLLARYRDQVPDLDAELKKIDVALPADAKTTPALPPSDATKARVALLQQGIQFDPPRQVGKRTFDDKEFYGSLAQQVENGRELSERQVNYLDRMILKYKEQMPDFEARTAALGIGAGEPASAAAPEVGELVGLVRQIKDWKPAVQRGKRTWDDKQFADSLARQFDQKKNLSPRQVFAMKKLLGNYAAQIAEFDALSERLGLKRRAAKKVEEA